MLMNYFVKNKEDLLDYMKHVRESHGGPDRLIYIDMPTIPYKFPCFIGHIADYVSATMGPLGDERFKIKLSFVTVHRDLAKTLIYPTNSKIPSKYGKGQYPWFPFPCKTPDELIDLKHSHEHHFSQVFGQEVLESPINLDSVPCLVRSLPHRTVVAAYKNDIINPHGLVYKVKFFQLSEHQAKGLVYYFKNKKGESNFL